jgi:hypothetical protein
MAAASPSWSAPCERLLPGRAWLRARPWLHCARTAVPLVMDCAGKAHEGVSAGTGLAHDVYARQAAAHSECVAACRGHLRGKGYKLHVTAATAALILG